MSIVIPASIIDALVSGAASSVLSGGLMGSGPLAAINAALGLTKAAPAAVAQTPAETALSMPASAWAKLSPDTQSIMVAANPQGIHLTAG